MDQDKFAEAQQVANENPAIPANPASTQVAKLMYEKQARIDSQGGGSVVSNTDEEAQQEPEVEQESEQDTESIEEQREQS